MNKKMIASPKVKNTLLEYVRKRVPKCDVEDVVQTVLTEALTAKDAPTEEDRFVRWILGVAHIKVAHFYNNSEPVADMVQEQAADMCGRALNDIWNVEARLAEEMQPEHVSITVKPAYTIAELSKLTGLRTKSIRSMLESHGVALHGLNKGPGRKSSPVVLLTDIKKCFGDLFDSMILTFLIAP